MSEYGEENNPHFQPRQRSDNTTPQSTRPESEQQPWDYHPTQIPQPERIQPQPRSRSQPRIPPPPLMVHLEQPPTPPRHQRPVPHFVPVDTPSRKTTRYSRPVDSPPVSQPTRHPRPVVVPPIHHPATHSGPVGVPPIHHPAPHSGPIELLPVNHHAQLPHPVAPHGHQPTRHSRPVDARPPLVYPPRPKPTRQSRPHHRPEHGPRHENLMYPERDRTNPLTWCGAVFCIILWLVIILGGLLVLIVYLVYRPRTPHFEISNASLNAVYLDMGYLLNADLRVLVNFTNPNKKVNVDFSYVILQLFFEKHLIANQYIEPFSAFSAEHKLANVEMVTSQVRLPMAVMQKMASQMQRNRIMFEVNGIFHARSNFGSLLRYSYWLYGHCSLEMTGPPSGIVVSSKCYTKD